MGWSALLLSESLSISCLILWCWFDLRQEEGRQRASLGIFLMCFADLTLMNLRLPFFFFLPVTIGFRLAASFISRRKPDHSHLIRFLVMVFFGSIGGRRYPS
jgi:hypothetical protein